MLHDPDTYPDPFTFDPERHIASPGKEAQKDPRKICFGYGRRICPGMYLAEASLYSCVSMSLSVFDIEKATENGVPITPVHENTSGIIRCVSDLTFFSLFFCLHQLIPLHDSYPKPFKCVIKPRSEKAMSLIAEEIL
jgi:hypothetical protein